MLPQLVGKASFGGAAHWCFLQKASLGHLLFSAAEMSKGSSTCYSECLWHSNLGVPKASAQ